MADFTAKAVLQTNRPLSGTFTTSNGVPLNDGDNVLATAQNAIVENGLYEVEADGPWIRLVDGMDYRKGYEVRILEGTGQELALWLQTDASGFLWRQETLGRLLTATGSLEIVDGNISLIPTGVDEGIYELATLSILEDGRIGNAIGAGASSNHMEGLGYSYLSPTQIQLRPGRAFIPGINRTIAVSTTLTGNVMPGANVATYIYLYETNGVGQLETSTTPPDVPYANHARFKIGDESRRYIGRVFNNAAGELLAFHTEAMTGNLVKLRYGYSYTPMRVVNGFTGNTDINSVVVTPDAPVAANRLVAHGAMSVFASWTVSGTAVKYIGYTPLAGGNPPLELASSMRGTDWVDLSPAGELRYKLANAADSIWLGIQGYLERR